MATVYPPEPVDRMNSCLRPRVKISSAMATPWLKITSPPSRATTVGRLRRDQLRLATRSRARPAALPVSLPVGGACVWNWQPRRVGDPSPRQAFAAPPSRLGAGHFILADGGPDPLRRQRRFGGGDLRYAAQDRFLTIFGEPEGVGLRATLLAIAHDDRLATLTD